MNYKRQEKTVFEVKTGHVVYEGDNAREMTRHLNFGGGFDGFTPDFFFQTLKVCDYPS